MADLGEVI